MNIFDVYSNANQAVQQAYEMLGANIYILNEEKSIKTLAITSVDPKDGRTSLAIGLSVAMATSGRKVLLVDADMRKPGAAKRLNEMIYKGLTDYLSGTAELHQAVSETTIENLYYLPCGPDTQNPIGLLSSSRFDELLESIEEEYDFAIFDTPALASVADGMMVASKVDSTLLVVKMGSTKFASLKRVVEQLEELNVDILGVVLNKVGKRDYKRHLRSYNYFFDPNKFLGKRNAKRYRKEKARV